MAIKRKIHQLLNRFYCEARETVHLTFKSYHFFSSICPKKSFFARQIISWTRLLVGKKMLSHNTILKKIFLILKSKFIIGNK